VLTSHGIARATECNAAFTAFMARVGHVFTADPRSREGHDRCNPPVPMMRRLSSPAVLCSLLASLALAACGAPSIPEMGADPSADGITEEPDDTSAPVTRTSDSGAAPRSDASTKPDGGADAGPVVQTFTVGSTDCNGGRCRAGYDGDKDPDELATATKQCIGHGFARATDFTLADKQPGGKFCSFKSGSYGCDNSCSGCNAIDTITCAK
jgi:hypothetical protein